MCDNKEKKKRGKALLHLLLDLTLFSVGIDFNNVLKEHKIKTPGIELTTLGRLFREQINSNPSLKAARHFHHSC